MINAEAGMGKTHYMCATAQRLSQRMNVYLLFGSRFNTIEDFDLQLVRMSGMKNILTLSSSLMPLMRGQQMYSGIQH